MNMRNIIKYSVFVLLAGIVFACRPHQYPHILVVADSLCEANPDSAVSLLRSLKPQFATAGKADRMYYQLLCIKAADKAFVPHESDSTILSVVDYYKSKGDKEKLAEAYFYAGSVYRDLNDAPEQLKYLQLSLDVMPDDYPLHRQMLTHYQIGRLFVLQDLDREAVLSFREAINLCKQEHDTLSLIHCLRDAAFAWESLNRTDKAIENNTMALRLANGMKDERLGDGIQMQIAACYNRQGDHEKALQLIRPILDKRIGRQDVSAFYSIASRIFEDNSMKDSALVYYNKLVNEGNPLGKCIANQKLAEYALSLKEYDKAYKHLSAFSVLSDSITRMNAAESVERMHSLYNYQLREKENARLSMSNKNKSIAIIVSIFTILFVISLSIIIWQHDRKKKSELKHGLDKLQRLKTEIEQASDAEIALNKQKIEQLRIQISRLGNENVYLRHQLEINERQLVSVVNRAEEKKNIKKVSEELMFSSDIYKTIHQSLSNKVPLKDSEWGVIENTVNNLFPDFEDRLSALLSLSEHELHICLLMKVKMKTNDIAVLTSRTKQAISNAKSRMYQKAFKVKGTADEWDKVIESL